MHRKLPTQNQHCLAFMSLTGTWIASCPQILNRPSPTTNPRDHDNSTRSHGNSRAGLIRCPFIVSCLRTSEVSSHEAKNIHRIFGTVRIARLCKIFALLFTARHLQPRHQCAGMIHCPEASFHAGDSILWGTEHLPLFLNCNNCPFMRDFCHSLDIWVLLWSAHSMAHLHWSTLTPPHPLQRQIDTAKAVLKHAACLEQGALLFSSNCPSSGQDPWVFVYQILCLWR